MADQFPLTGRPQVQQRSAQPVLPALAARQGDYLGALPAADSTLSGLLQGLQSLNPRIQAMQAASDKEMEQRALDEAAAAAHRVEKPLDAVTGAAVQVPAWVPPALGKDYQRQHATIVAQRAAIDITHQTAQAYESEKNATGFSLDAFLNSSRQEALAGVADPHMASVIGNAHAQLGAQLRSEDNKLRLQQHQDRTTADVFMLANQGVTPSMNAAEIAQWYAGTFRAQAKNLQFDDKQSAGVLLQAVTQASVKAGGLPDLFDAFAMDSGDGQSILAKNPGLSPAIEAARDHARITRERALHEATEPGRAVLLDELHQGAEKGILVPEQVFAHVSKYELGAAQAVSLLAASRKRSEEGADWARVLARFDAGTLGIEKPDTQQAVFDAKLGPTVEALWDAAAKSAAGNDPQASAQLAQTVQYLTQSVSKSGASVQLKSLQRFVEQNVSNLPSPDGPTPGFKALAAIYTALSANPGFRDGYFKDKTDELFSEYTKALPGSTEKEAYMQAYTATSPEAKAMAAKRLTDPDFQKKMATAARDYATGSTNWFTGLFGGAGRPSNGDEMGYWASSQARSFMQAHPNHSDADVKDYIRRVAERSWVMDPNTGVAIKVPEGQANAATLAAFQTYGKDFLDAGVSRGAIVPGSKITYSAVGDQGQYEVTAWDGSVGKALGVVSLDQVRRAHAMKTELSDPAELAQVGALKKALASGQPLPVLSPQLMGKARALALTSGESQQLDTAMRSQFMGALQSMPKMNLGKPDLGTASLSSGRTGVDNQLTSNVARDFVGGSAAPGSVAAGLQRPDVALSHEGLAASLITLREGVALSAYRDPNSAAGMNIGMGYNFKANAATVDQDLKASGVPQEALEAVKAGRAQITDVQARRLLQVSMGRYEAQVKSVAEKTAPGLWTQMTPAQKAVMVDVAWQAGDPAKFTKAWAALGSGDEAAFRNETKTFYRKTPDGPLVEDTRAHQLRVHMLAGISTWKALLQQNGKRPSTTLNLSP